MSEYHTVLSEPVCGLLFILGFEKARFLRRGNFDVAASKAIGDGRVATLNSAGRGEEHEAHAASSTKTATLRLAALT